MTTPQEESQMKIELQINNSPKADARFVGWAPAACRLRVTDPAGALTKLVNIQLTCPATIKGGAVVFRKGTTGKFADSLTLSVPVNGTFVPFFIAGKFGHASIANGDVKIEARAKLGLLPTPATLVGKLTCMVRVRKNAESLTNAERDRFVAAFAQLNDQGNGKFTDFRNMHTDVSSPQAHGAPGFLPWHRSYLLDLERELQAIDSSVALPYWRFDQAAPKLFTLDFFGVSDALGTVQFSNTNPLQFWVTDGVQGINRRPLNNWDPTTQPGPGVITEAAT